uniref:Uncharacterized protein n=1 Tax=Lepeophtheirus salmonis TaxID=72036 RepID=A0A0K2VFI1_LEPSM
MKYPFLHQFPGVVMPSTLYYYNSNSSAGNISKGQKARNIGLTTALLIFGALPRLQDQEIV